MPCDNDNRGRGCTPEKGVEPGSGRDAGWHLLGTAAAMAAVGVRGSQRGPKSLGHRAVTWDGHSGGPWGQRVPSSPVPPGMERYPVWARAHVPSITNTKSTATPSPGSVEHAVSGQRCQHAGHGCLAPARVHATTSGKFIRFSETRHYCKSGATHLPGPGTPWQPAGALALLWHEALCPTPSPQPSNLHHPQPPKSTGRAQEPDKPLSSSTN